MEAASSTVLTAASTRDRRHDDDDNSNNNNIPSAEAILLPSEPPNSTHIVRRNSNPFVDAQVVDGNFHSSPDPMGFYTASTEVVAEAVPLDPWTKTQTTSTAALTTTCHTTRTTAATNENDSLVVAVTEEPQIVTPVYSSRLDIRRNKLARAMMEDPFAKKYRRRKRRRSRMVVGGATGFVVGTMVFGPIGGLAGLATAVAVTRTASKLGERRKDGRVRRERERLEEERNSLRESGSSAESPVILEAYGYADPSERRRSRRRNVHPRSCRTR